MSSIGKRTEEDGYQPLIDTMGQLLSTLTPAVFGLWFTKAAGFMTWNFMTLLRVNSKYSPKKIGTMRASQRCRRSSAEIRLRNARKRGVDRRRRRQEQRSFRVNGKQGDALGLWLPGHFMGYGWEMGWETVFILKKKGHRFLV
jgi:hypothetical protein